MKETKDELQQPEMDEFDKKYSHKLWYKIVMGLAELLGSLFGILPILLVVGLLWWLVL